MKAGGEVRPANTEENSHGIANISCYFVDFCQRQHIAVEHHMFRIFIQHFFQRELVQTARAMSLRRIKFTLHNVELAFNRRQPTFRLYQYHAVHTVGDMLSHHRCGAVVNVESWLQGLKTERFCLSRWSLGHRRAAARASGRMEIHGVNVGAFNGVLHVDIHSVANTYTHEGTGNGVVECPETIAASLSQSAFHFGGFKIKSDGTRCTFADRLAYLMRAFR